jgi:ribosomal-protein-alanine N-acetyltransferase
MAGRAPQLAVRRMVPDDLEEVMVIERAAFKHPWSTELFRRELDHDWSTVLLALEQKAQRQEVVGFLIYWLVHDEIHVLNVAVAPEQRRRGIARFLLAETEKRARAADCALLTLEVRRSNTGAIALYQEQGYQQAGVRPRYYADENEDAIVMNLELRDRGF